MIDLVCKFLFSDKVTNLIVKLSDKLLIQIIIGVSLTLILFFLSSQSLKMFVLSVVTSIYIMVFMPDVWIFREYSFIAKDLCAALRLDVNSNTSKFIFLVDYFLMSLILILIVIMN